MVDRRTPGLARRRAALVGVLAAALAALPPATGAGALPGDPPGDDVTEPVDEVLEEPTEDTAAGIEDLAEDASDTLAETTSEATEAAEQAGEPVEEAAGTVADTVEDLTTTDSPADGDADPPAGGDGGVDSGDDRAGRQQAGDTRSGDGGEPEPAAVGADGEGPTDEAPAFAGGPVGGPAFARLRDPLRTRSQAYAAFRADALPPVVGTPELVEAPVIAGSEQQRLASVRMPAPSPAGWPATTGGSERGAVPAPLFATAAGLLLALAAAHALHAAGYLRPSFVRTTD